MMVESNVTVEKHNITSAFNNITQKADWTILEAVVIAGIFTELFLLSKFINYLLIYISIYNSSSLQLWKVTLGTLDYVNLSTCVSLYRVCDHWSWDQMQLPHRLRLDQWHLRNSRLLWCEWMHKKCVTYHTTLYSQRKR